MAVRPAPEPDAYRKSGAEGSGYSGGIKPQQEIMHLVSSGQKTAADAARLFNVHPATVSRLLQGVKMP